MVGHDTRFLFVSAEEPLCTAKPSSPAAYCAFASLAGACRGWLAGLVEAFEASDTLSISKSATDRAFGYTGELAGSSRSGLAVLVDANQTLAALHIGKSATHLSQSRSRNLANAVVVLAGVIAGRGEVRHRAGAISMVQAEAEFRVEAFSCSADNTVARHSVAGV